MKKVFKSLSVCLAALTVLCAYPLFSADNTGKNGTAAAVKKRIVSLSPAVTETLFHLGCGDMLVGRSTACDFPEEAKTLPVAGDFSRIFAEPVSALKPDVLISNELYYSDDIATLKKLGIKTLLIPVSTIGEYCASLVTLGNITGTVEKAQKAAAAAASRLKGLQERSAGLKTRPKILWVIWDSPLLAAGHGSFPDSIIMLAGGENVLNGSKQKYIRPDLEFLLVNQPDAIIWTVHGSKDGPDAKDPFWGKLKAVREKHIIIPENESVLLRPGPRIFDAADDLFFRLHPEKKMEK